MVGAVCFLFVRASWGDLIEGLIPQAVASAIQSSQALRAGLPRDYLEYMGVVHSDEVRQRATKWTKSVRVGAWPHTKKCRRPMVHLNREKGSDGKSSFFLSVSTAIFSVTNLWYARPHELQELGISVNGVDAVFFSKAIRSSAADFRQAVDLRGSWERASLF